MLIYFKMAFINIARLERFEFIQFYKCPFLFLPVNEHNQGSDCAAARDSQESLTLKCTTILSIQMFLNI